MSRVNINDTIKDMVFKMSDGNPGAMAFIMSLVQEDDPKNIMTILTLDTIGLYGSKLYMLWNDCCGRDNSKVKLVIQKFCEGVISKQDIFDHVSDVYGKPFEL